MPQLLCDEVFAGKVRRNTSGRFSLTNLSKFDVERILSALGGERTQANVNAHQVAPHWWDEKSSGSHRQWFASQVRYYREACDTIRQGLDRR